MSDNQLTPSTRPGGLTPKAASIRAAFADPSKAPAVLSNIAQDDPDGDALFMRTLGEADYAAEDMFGIEFELTRWIVMPVTWESDDNGEARQGLRTILIDSQGRTASFGSDGIVKSLDMLIARRGPGPWNPPIKIKLAQIKLKSGHRTYALELVRD